MQSIQFEPAPHRGIPPLSILRQTFSQKRKFKLDLPLEHLRLLTYESYERLCNPHYTVSGGPHGIRFRFATQSAMRSHLQSVTKYRMNLFAKADLLVAWVIFAYPERWINLLQRPNEVLSRVTQALQYSPAVRLAQQQNMSKQTVLASGVSAGELRAALHQFGFKTQPSRLPVTELKGLYRQLAKQSHPDRGGSRQTFERLNESYSVLKQHFGFK
ncbi:MAG: J domain-containing protein [Cyanobacteria bacterium P01_H01_bin.15]